LHWVINVGNARREFDAEITEQIPDKRIAWKSIGGKSHAGVVTFHRLSDDQTRVAMQMSYDPEGFLENVADVLGVISSRVEGDLRRFKGFIESRGVETGAWRGEVKAPGER
ncbi:MAG: SRPBCC family protein, partial [Candidatus Binatia bacterium]